MCLRPSTRVNHSGSRRARHRPFGSRGLERRIRNRIRRRRRSATVHKTRRAAARSEPRRCHCCTMSRLAGSHTASPKESRSRHLGPHNCNHSHRPRRATTPDRSKTSAPTGIGRSPCSPKPPARSHRGSDLGDCSRGRTRHTRSRNRRRSRSGSRDKTIPEEASGKSPPPSIRSRLTCTRAGFGRRPRSRGRARRTHNRTRRARRNTALGRSSSPEHRGTPRRHCSRRHPPSTRRASGRHARSRGPEHRRRNRNRRCRRRSSGCTSTLRVRPGIRRRRCSRWPRSGTHRVAPMRRRSPGRKRRNRNRTRLWRRNKTHCTSTRRAAQRPHSSAAGVPRRRGLLCERRAGS